VKYFILTLALTSCRFAKEHDTAVRRICPEDAEFGDILVKYVFDDEAGVRDDRFEMLESEDAHFDSLTWTAMEDGVEEEFGFAIFSSVMKEELT